jgi:hypothetical protein
LLSGYQRAKSILTAAQAAEKKIALILTAAQAAEKIVEWKN